MAADHLMSTLQAMESQWKWSQDLTTAVLSKIGGRRCMDLLYKWYTEKKYNKAGDYWDRQGIRPTQEARPLPGE